MNIGFQNAKQCFKSKDCGRLFIENQKKTCPAEIRQKAIVLYVEGLGFRAIGGVLRVSNVTVLNWVLQAAKELTQVEILEFDDMRHFVRKKQKLFLWLDVECFINQASH
ncbi:MAG: hypothetical protein AAGI66_07450 [Cyanobacteria bacterium P01_H01_bin.74]